MYFLYYFPLLMEMCDIDTEIEISVAMFQVFAGSQNSHKPTMAFKRL